ncbi:hypothetical cytosolic protein [Syntrophus aciditrophicus SB]|uniref:Hypothetical cytosolic protein n=1 Tax=Syntrophus aciditrophicus (strain SB) TaxID=56780 RepID=Q2LRU9_SYNAS|nr:hypothetical cytosolic protein [Syntrophus aciditrophicus SB]
MRFAAEVDPIRGMEIQRDLLYKFSSRHGYFNGLFEKYGIYNEFNVSYNESKVRQYFESKLSARIYNSF